MRVDNYWPKMMLNGNVTLLPGRAKEITEDAVIWKNDEVAPADIVI